MVNDQTFAPILRVLHYEHVGHRRHGDGGIIRGR
jgi:hypothetical protein